MKNKYFAFISICTAIIALASCEKPVPQLTVYVPKDASVVFTIDTKAITEKIASSGITVDSFVNMFSENSDAYAMHWSDIKNSGIDLEHPVYIFGKETTSVQLGNVKSGGFIAQILDTKKLEAFLKKEKVDGEIKAAKNYKYMALGDDFIAGWTDKVLIISSVSGGTYSPGSYSTGEGTLSQQQLTTLFSQDESASIASVGEFRDVLAKPGDIHFYTNTQFSAGPMAMLGKANELMQGSFTEGTINFEKGKMVASVETHNSKALADIVKKYPSREIKTDMVTRFPDDVSGFGVVAFDPKILIDVLHYAGFDMMANGYTSQMGFNISDVMNAFSGDIAFVIGNANASASNSNGENNSSVHSRSEYLLNLRIADQVAFNKVMKGLTDKNVLSKNGDEYELGMFGGHDFVIKLMGNELIIASNANLIESYETGNSKSTLPDAVQKEMDNKSAAMYIDFARLFRNNNSKDSSTNIRLRDTYFAMRSNTFKNLIITGDNGDGKTMHGNIELNFVNENENSLASFAKFLAVMHQENLEHKGSWTAFPPLSKLPGADSMTDEKDSQ